MSQLYADIIIDISHEAIDKTFQYTRACCRRTLRCYAHGKAASQKAGASRFGAYISSCGHT